MLSFRSWRRREETLEGIPPIIPRPVPHGMDQSVQEIANSIKTEEPRKIKLNQAILSVVGRIYAPD